MFLSDKKIAERYGVSRKTVWDWLKTYADFPRPVKLSPGCTRWKLAEIEAWEAARAKSLVAA